MDKKQENKIRYMRRKAGKGKNQKAAGKQYARLSSQAARFYRENEK